MYHDTLMSLVVVAVIIGLAVIWPLHARPSACHAAADPGTFSFVPRPDWYFYFLFYLLRIFKWPESVILGTIGVPTIALVLLIALPFIDLRRERRLSRRPVAAIAFILVVLSMATLTWKGATAKGGKRRRPPPPCEVDERPALGPQAAQPGAQIVTARRLPDLPHTIDGAGRGF